MQVRETRAAQAVGTARTEVWQCEDTWGLVWGVSLVEAELPSTGEGGQRKAAHSCFDL